ncbi:hypothetical protein [Streptomyces aureus]|uniref:hypothetical protein n=1 Tax=Streptomyces aureus TaxID=193461 RepID=UPI003408FF2A
MAVGGEAGHPYVSSAGAGGDTIYGNTGNDLLHGGTGTDRLSGGQGADRVYQD